MNEELKPCPFCAGGGTRIFENFMNRTPTMSGKPPLIISVEITHWCEKVEGQPWRNTITRTGRDMDSAIALWNTRT